jgi:hypothetical protein
VRCASLKPTDLPEIRVRQIDGWEKAAALLMGKSYEDHSAIQWGLRDWKLAELFYVTEDMARLALAAARSLPDFELRREDLPSEFGLMYFALPLSDSEQVTCCTWGLHGAGVEVKFYGPSGFTPPYMTLQVVDVAELGLGREIVTSLGHDGAQLWAHTVRCAWLMMQQRVAAVTDQWPDRASARRLARSGQTARPVRVITLRQAEAHPGGESDREYHHRWVVRGHWRKQWYASQNRNVPIWISPYVKGPEGAPLLSGEKVYAWTR